MKEIWNCMSKTTLFQLLTAVIGNLMAISDGMTAGWTAPMIPYFLSEKSHIKMTEEETEWLETSQLIGAVVGVPITVFSLNRLGRKITLISACFVLMVSWIIIAIATAALPIFFARFINGIFGEMSFAAAVTYVSETADKKHRGLLTSLTYLMHLVGVLVIYCTGPFLPYYVPCVIGAALLFIEIIVFCCFPETPYYLLYNQRNTEAKMSMAKFRPSSCVEGELKEIGGALEKQKAERRHLRDIFSIKSNRKAILIITVLNTAEQFGSFNVILMNLHTILEAADSVFVAPTTAAILFAVVMPIAAVQVSLSIDRLGRRKLLIISSILTGICLLSLAIYFNLKFVGYNLSGYNWIPSASVMIYAYVFKLGLGMVPIVIAGEIFPTSIRAFGVTLSGALYSFMALCSIQIYHLLVNSIGFHVPFYLFSCCAFLTVGFVLWVVPETKGKSLEGIQEMLRGENGGGIAS